MPYLLEVVQHAVPTQVAVTRLLGEMLRGGADAPNDLAVYTSRAPSSANEAATRRAVEAGAPVLAALLDAPDALVRCAAIWTNAALGPVVRPVLADRLRVEPDVRARICGWIALSTLEAPLSVEQASSSLATGNAVIDEVAEADVLAVLGAAQPLDDVIESAFVRLLGAPEVSWLAFAEGRVHELAIHHLRRIGRDEPRLVPILECALASERGEDAHPFGHIAALLSWAVFPAGVPRLAAELNDAQRWALRNVWVGEARGVRLAYGNLEGQRAFVDGGGPIDEVVTFAGRTCSVAEWVVGNVAEAEPLLAECARQLPGARVFELPTAITRGDLGYEPALVDALVRTCGSSVTLERTLAYLAAPDPSLTEHDAALLLSPYLLHGLPSPEALDPLALVWLRSGKAKLCAWLRAFSPRRRVQLVATLGGSFAEFWSLCDRDALGKAVLDLFIGEPLRVGEYALEAVPTSVLRSRVPNIADPNFRAQLDRVFEARATRTQVSLSARRIHTMTMEVMLPHGMRLALLDVDETRTSDDLEPIRQVLRDHPNAALTVYTRDAPTWISDTLRDELGDRVTLR